jgi:hypothetical protein
MGVFKLKKGTVREMGTKTRKKGLQNFDILDCIFCTTRIKNDKLKW